MPDDAAVEKQHELEARGACVERVRPVAISNPQHMVHQARQAASPASVDEHSAAALQRCACRESQQWRRGRPGTTLALSYTVHLCTPEKEVKGENPKKT